MIITSAMTIMIDAIIDRDTGIDIDRGTVAVDDLMVPSNRNTGPTERESWRASERIVIKVRREGEGGKASRGKAREQRMNRTLTDGTTMMMMMTTYDATVDRSIVCSISTAILYC